jgi:predicted MPP superfamily phosphohydrolase
VPLFLIFTAFIFGLQYFHRKLLQQILPKRVDRWVAPALLILHLPLAAFVGLRLVGIGGMTTWMRTLARVGLYFQMITVLNLFLWAMATLIWRLAHLWRNGFGAPPENPDRRRFLRQTSAAGASMAAYGAMAGTLQARADPEIVRHEFHFPSLPAGLDGLRLVQISDLHAGPLMHEGQLARWRRLAEAERPELLLITGDFVDSLPEEVEAFVAAFKGFRAPRGIFAILGNHDYFTDPRPIWQALEAMGIQLLENKHAVVERNGALLALVGLQDGMASHGHFRGIRYGPGPSPEVAIQGIPPTAWRLCLSHRPNDWPLARRTGAHLTLSGHTHAGQVNLIPGLSSALVMGPYTQGLFTKGDDHLYVNRGLGVVGLPLRIAAPAEITVLTLRQG